MIELRGYEIIHQIHVGRRSAVFRARRRVDGADVVLKTTASSEPDAKRRRQLETEAGLLRRVDHAAVVRVLDVLYDGARPVMVLEDFGGISLSARPEPSLPLRNFLRFALQAVEGLAATHAAGIVHRDLHSQNLIFSARAGLLELVDFGSATLLTRSGPNEGGIGLLPGLTQRSDRLAYWSPEQTGATGRPVDHRSDLYSLGVVLFELLCGVSPLPAVDSASGILTLLATTAPSALALSPEVPEVIAAVLSRLLCKQVDERYPSADSLLADLKIAWERLHQDGNLGVFQLGAHDFSEQLVWPDRLVGRRREVATMAAALERACDGASELVVLRGPSGVGKTRLAEELIRPCVLRGAKFARAACDPHQSQGPRAPLFAAVRMLIAEEEARDPEGCASWRVPLRDALHVDGALAADLSGSSSLDLEASRWLVADERTSRFRRALARVMGTLARAESPVVIYLEDIHWADPETLEALEYLLTVETPGHFLVLVDGLPDLPEEHPLSTWLDRLERKSASLSSIDVTPLRLEPMAELLCDALRCSFDRATPLALHVLEHVGGIPLIAKLYVESAVHNGLIIADPVKSSWGWDLARFGAAALPEAVSSLARARVGTGDPNLETLLCGAAHIGPRFDAALVADIAAVDASALGNAICAGVQKGLLSACDESPTNAAVHSAWALDESMLCRFTHEAVRRALADGDTSHAVHQRYALALESRLDEGATDRDRFEAAAHLLASGYEPDDAEGRRRMLDTLRQAGEAAWSRAAYRSGYKLHKAAIDRIERWGGEADDHSFGLSCQRYDCLSAFGDELSLEASGRELCELARDPTERLMALARVVPAMASRLGDAERAVALGAAALQSFWIDLEPEDPEAALSDAHKELSRRAKAGLPETLARLEPMTDAEALAIAGLLHALVAHALPRAAPELLVFAAKEALLLCLEHGRAPVLGLALAHWSAGLAHRAGELSLGYALGTAAQAIADSDEYDRARVALCRARTTEWLGDTFESAYGLARRALRMALEAGDESTAVEASDEIMVLGWMAGVPLTQLCRVADSVESSLGPTPPSEVRATALLKQVTERWHAVHTSGLALPLPQGTRGRVLYHLLTAQWHLMLSDDGRLALDAAEAALERADPQLHGALVYEAKFLHALALAKVHDTALPEQRDDLRRALRRHARSLQAWVDGGARRAFEAMSHLVSAELARVEGEVHAAETSFERGLRVVETHRAPVVRALLHELAGRFFLQRGFRKAAVGYFWSARSAYESWGATAKVRLLEERFGDVLSPVATKDGGQVPSVTSGPEPTLSIPQVDHLLAACRTLTACPSEEDLLRTLARLAREHTGAERAVVLLGSGEALLAKAWSRDDALAKDSSVSDEAPETLVRSVLDTSESVVLGDAEHDSTLRGSAYAKLCTPRSVMALALVTDGVSVGVLYAEHAQETHLFSPERVRAAEWLGAHAVVVLGAVRRYRLARAATAKAEGRARVAPVEPGPASVRAAELDRATIERALAESGHVVTRAAKAFGMSRQTFARRMKKLGIEPRGRRRP